jgi:hypothetical protein
VGGLAACLSETGPTRLTASGALFHVATAVPAFQALCLQLWQSLPASAKGIVEALAGVVMWYWRGGSATPQSAIDAARAQKAGSQSGFARHGVLVLLLVISTLAMSLIMTGCSDWEHQTYKVLSADKAVVDQAVADYNAGKIPQTTVDREIVDKARAAHNTAVQAFAEYERLQATLKATNAGPGSDAYAKAEQARQVAIQALSDLPALIEALKPLLAKK